MEIETMKAQRIVLVGCGLIGGSLALAWKRAGVAGEIIGVDRREDHLQEALLRGAIDRAAALEEAVCGADVVVLATPVQQSLQLLGEMAQFPLSPACIVTDVGGTKREICKRAEEVLPPSYTFIGGHPMAGSEKSGIRAASPRLFENAVYVLTPRKGERQEAVSRLKSLVETTGAQVLLLEAERHDRLVAAISHLPHVVAAQLVEQVADLGEDDPLYAVLAAGGFRDVTRIASGHPGMWREVLLTNGDLLLPLLQNWRQRFSRLEKWIQEKDGDAIETFFRRSAEWRDSLPARGRGALRPVFSCMVDVPDEPGTIGRIATLLGEHAINLRNIGILESREGDNGQLQLTFAEEQARKEAMVLLAEKGYSVHIHQ